MASLSALILWILFIPNDYFVRIIILSILLLISFFAINISLKFFNEKDPQSIVIDEVVGMYISLLFIVDNIILLLVAFFLFRMFDILKPSIIYYSQFYKQANGILLDDILSGLLTMLLLINYI